MVVWENCVLWGIFFLFYYVLLSEEVGIVWVVLF